MKATPDCIPCFFRQALNTSRMVTADPAVQIEIFSRLARRVPDLDFADTPAGLSQDVYRIISEVTGIADPYREIKRQTNETAMALLPRLEATIDQSPDPLRAAIHLAAAGNVIDLGIGHEFDIEADAVRIMAEPFAIDAYDEFRKELRPGRRMLYLGDNAGEIVFDRVLVERLLARGLDVTFSVKAGPIINDATREDAEAVGLCRLTRVITTGSDDIGVRWPNVSHEFAEAFGAADVILAKGHGNFETCCSRPENLYFLLKAKCELVAAELGVRLGDVVFKHGG